MGELQNRMLSDTTCTAVDGCQGASLAPGPCIGHLNVTDLTDFLANLDPECAIDARGATVREDLIQTLFQNGVFSAAAGHRIYFNRATFTGDAIFRGATFTGHAAFGGATFHCDAYFPGATFTGVADFLLAKFNGDAAFGDMDFDGATFTGNANFRGARFSGHADFRGATFTGPADFRGATFIGPADFRGATFIGPADFGGATFTGPADFGGATSFTSDANFRGATSFTGDADFGGATFTGDANFGGATFHSRCRIGPVRAARLSLTSATFEGDTEIHCHARTLDADRIRASHGMTMTARGGEISISGAVFGGPTTIAASPAEMDFPAWPSSPPPDREAERDSEPFASPRPPVLLTVVSADTTNLTLAGLDLRCCKFLGAYNVDLLRIDGPPLFATTPSGWRWDRRLTIAEEHEWRARYDRRPQGWFAPACRHPGSEPPPHQPTERSTAAARAAAARIQAAYRELRKGREDAKDEPGAADFYYGEMEMRRMASRGTVLRPRTGARLGSVERMLLTVYWVASGFGLRAGRALISLALVLALATVGFATVGFGLATNTVYVPTAIASGGPATYRQTTVPTHKPGLAEAAYYSIESATSLLKQTKPEPLTTFGRMFEVALRVLGPLLLGLAVLAVRGRVKR